MTKATEKKPAAKKAAPKKAVPKKTTTKKVVSEVSNKLNIKKGGDKIVTSDINGVGRRKSSVARVWLSPKGKPGVTVNGRTVEAYFNTPETRADAVKSLVLCDLKDKVSLKVSIQGGGMCSQAGAMRLGIARTLVKVDEKLKPTFREHDLLTVDARVKERKKPGQRGARRKFQFVKR